MLEGRIFEKIKINVLNEWYQPEYLILSDTSKVDTFLYHTIKSVYKIDAPLHFHFQSKSTNWINVTTNNVKTITFSLN